MVAGETDKRDKDGDMSATAASAPEGASLRAPHEKPTWEPMKLVEIGTVASLLQAAQGSVSDGNTGSGPKMRPGP